MIERAVKSRGIRHQNSNIIVLIIKANYRLLIYFGCLGLREVYYDDVISSYTNPILIHKGGQRVVFKAVDPKYGTVALKIGYYKTPNNPDGWDIERIEREIDILRSIDSEYYPKNFDFRKISDDRYVVTEEFIESTPLAGCMDRYYYPLHAMNLTKVIVTGLKVIWDKNIVHRDLKPDNILITPDGRPRIIDLGIARSLDSISITQSWMGGPCTKIYAAPELLVYNKKMIDTRTDQYSLGIILVQLLLKSIHPFDPQLVGGNSIPRFYPSFIALVYPHRPHTANISPVDSSKPLSISV